MRMARFSNAHHGTVYLHPDHVVRVVENKNKGGVNVTLSTSTDNKPDVMYLEETLETAIRVLNAAMRPRPAEKARSTIPNETAAS